MFSNKPFIEVNREERFYCALFGHALLSSQLVRVRFASLARTRFQLSLDPDNLEVFLEVSALRDYWNDLGDPKVYSAETHHKRKGVLVSILQLMGIPEKAIDAHDFFWTSEQHIKLWNPGRWKQKGIEQSGLDVLLTVRWAFNARPDILIVSGSDALLIEGKLESGEGRDEDTGYGQYDIQEVIVRLMQSLVPQFNDTRFQKTVLSLNRPDGITWKEVSNLIEGAGLDGFTQRCFLQLQRYF